MKKNRIKCFIVWLIFGHSDTSTGEQVEMIQCLGCNSFVFKRK